MPVAQRDEYDPKAVGTPSERDGDDLEGRLLDAAHPGGARWHARQCDAVDLGLLGEQLLNGLEGHVALDEVVADDRGVAAREPDEGVSRAAVADIAEALMPWITDLGWYRSGDFQCGPGRQGAPEYDDFGPEYSICASSSADPGGDGTRSGAELDIATEP